MFSENNLHDSVKVDAAVWTNVEPNEEYIVNSISNTNEDENEQAVQLVRRNTPEVSMALRNITYYVKKSYCSSYKLST